jgi:hypothetical protein
MVRMGKENSMTKPLKKWGAGIMTLGLALQLSGCFFVADDDTRASPPMGSLMVEWTVDGQQSGLDCADLGVDRLEIVIYDSSGAEVDEIEPFCESFAVAVDLEEGRYFADVTLVDSLDRAATLTETIERIVIIAGTELNVEVDFPIDSFL